MDPERRRIKNLINNYIKVADLSDIVLQYLLAEIAYYLRQENPLSARPVTVGLFFGIDNAIFYALRVGVVNRTIVEVCALDFQGNFEENPIISYGLIDGIFYTMDTSGSKCDEYFGWDYIPLYAKWKQTLLQRNDLCLALHYQYQHFMSNKEYKRFSQTLAATNQNSI